MFRTLKKFFDFCGEKERKQFYCSIFLGVFNALFIAMRIPAVYVVIKALLEGGLSDNTAYAAAGIIAASIILQTIVSMKTTMLQTRGGYNTASFKRMEIAEHLRYVPMGYFNSEGLGKVTSIATNTMENLSGIATRCVMVITKGIITTLVIVASMFVFHFKIALVALATMIVYLIGTEFMIRAERADSDSATKAQDTMVSRILEYVRGIAEIRNFNLFGKNITNVDAAIDNFTTYSTHMETTYEIAMFLLSILNKLSGVVMMLMSIAFYLNGTMSLVYAVMMMICSFMIFESLDQVGAFNGLTRTVENCVDKANEALSSPTMDIDGKDMTPENMTLTVRTDVREYSYDSLMQNFAFVFQNVYLFSDTIENNIRFGKPDASREEVIQAAKAACCHDFIMELPDGYDTVIGEGGASLSGGERQRISIARAIMKNAPIIILDEATANVDPENENLLMKAVESLTKEKTVIMIAHRLKTVENADQIFVIDHGKIVQRGKHHELMNEDGIYRRFIRERKEAAGWKLGSHSA